MLLIIIILSIAVCCWFNLHVLITYLFICNGWNEIKIDDIRFMIDIWILLYMIIFPCWLWLLIFFLYVYCCFFLLITYKWLYSFSFRCLHILLLFVNKDLILLIIQIFCCLLRFAILFLNIYWCYFLLIANIWLYSWGWRCQHILVLLVNKHWTSFVEFTIQNSLINIHLVYICVFLAIIVN